LNGVTGNAMTPESLLRSVVGCMLALSLEH
jgi:hypothetical protein